jgi:cytochrome oxidase Cu insertion factor (SCO1/SenC/PrrC family)
MRYVPTVALACGLLLGTLATGSLGGDAPDAKTGLKVGTRAPAFTLKDQHGKERSLAELLKEGKVALVFFRSAGW